jgi:hypothetical protein
MLQAKVVENVFSAISGPGSKQTVLRIFKRATAPNRHKPRIPTPCIRYFFTHNSSNLPNGMAQWQRRGGRDSFSIMHDFWQNTPARSGRAVVRLKAVLDLYSLLHPRSLLLKQLFLLG